MVKTDAPTKTATAEAPAPPAAAEPPVAVPAGEAKSETKAVRPLPTTPEEFREELRDVFERAKKAGFQPIKIMGEHYLRKGAGMIRGVLDGLEDKKA